MGLPVRRGIPRGGPRGTALANPPAMRSAMLAATLLVLGGAPAACGGTSSGGAGAAGNDGGAGASSGTAGASGSAGGRFVADPGCLVAGDCGAGESCIRVVPDGYGRCAVPAVEATSCVAGPPGDECCSTAACSSGACIPTTSYPSGPCGGGGADVTNKCLSDACSTDADCAAGEVCAPAGIAGPVRTCLNVSCEHDADCSAEAGGKCVWIAGGCCGGVGSGWDFRPGTLACAYPDGGCQSDAADCPTGEFCVIDAGRAHCGGACH